jgi:hypothetical protein
MRAVLSGVVSGLMLAGLAACAGGATETGPRPPQGVGPGGTNFGHWARDQEGAVDSEYRTHIMSRWNVGQEAAARAALETDGFKCIDGNRPDGRPVPNLECNFTYHVNEDVHAWTVEFWPDDKEPKARYVRTQVRNPLIDYEAKGR